MLKNFEGLVTQDILAKDVAITESMAEEIERVRPAYMQEWEDVWAHESM